MQAGVVIIKLAQPAAGGGFEAAKFRGEMLAGRGGQGEHELGGRHPGHTLIVAVEAVNGFLERIERITLFTIVTLSEGPLWQS